MRIYVCRHAWAGHYGDPDWPDDSLRPLTAEGIERYRSVVSALAERGFAPERIATSPYVRCVQTAALIAEGTPHAPEVEELAALEPGSDVRDLLRWTGAAGLEEVAWVGHNPDVERLVGVLVGGAEVRFAKGAVAAIEFSGPLAPGAGSLLWHVSAKVLGL